MSGKTKEVEMGEKKVADKPKATSGHGDACKLWPVVAQLLIRAIVF